METFYANWRKYISNNLIWKDNVHLVISFYIGISVIREYKNIDVCVYQLKKDFEDIPKINQKKNVTERSFIETNIASGHQKFIPYIKSTENSFIYSYQNCC